MKVACALLVVCLAACSEPIELEWRKPLGAASVSTPLVTAGFIAVGHERGVSVLEPSGAMRCSFDARGEVVSRPAFDGQRIFFGGTDYVFYAIDPGCRELWRFATQDRIKSDPALGDGRVYTTSYDGHVYAFEAASGKLAWRFPNDKSLEHEMSALAKTLVEPAGPPAPNDAIIDVGDFSYSSPLVSDNVLYVGNLDGYVYALAANTGALIWRLHTGGAVTSSPKKGELIYVGSNDGYVYAIDPVAATNAGPMPALETPGVVRWRFQTQDWVNSSAALDGDTLYIGSNDRTLYALDARSGATRWRFATKGPVVTVPVVYKNLVFAAGGSGDGTLYAVDKASGAQFWKYVTAAKIESDPVVAGEQLYVTGGDQSAYAFVIRETKAKQ